MSPHRVLLTGGHDVGGSLSWTTDSASIIVAHPGHETADVDRVVDLWSVPLDGGQPARLTDGQHAWSQPVVSAERRSCRGLPRRTSRSRCATQSSCCSTHRRVTAVEIAPGLDRGRSHVSPSGVQFDGGRIWFMIEDAGSTALYAAPSDPILIGERVVSGVDVRAGRIAFTESLPTGPFRLVVRDATSGAERELASYPLPFPTTAPQKLVATASDGTAIDAWFVPPADVDPARTYPVLLNIHGGPYSQYGYGFFDEFQVQSAAGYGVVYCNPRGSSGYGEAWGRAIRGPKCAVDPGVGWGAIDSSDVLSVLDAALEAHPYLDADRAGVLGGSYGGYLTSWLVTQTDRFAAACSERAVNNMVTMTHTSDIGWWFNSEYAGVTPMEDTDELLRMSPSHLCRAHHDAAADRAQRERLAMPHRAGRRPLHAAAHARARRRVRAIPGRGPRALAVRRPQTPGRALRDHPRLLQSSLEVTTDPRETGLGRACRPRLSIDPALPVDRLQVVVPAEGRPGQAPSERSAFARILSSR